MCSSDLLRKVRPSPGISLCDCLPKSHLKKILSCLEVLSIFGVWIAEHFLQNHLWDPDLFFPYRIQTLLQTGQITCFIVPSSVKLISKKIQRHFFLIFQYFSDFSPTLFVHPVSCFKKDKTAVFIEKSTKTAVFTNSFCPITPFLFIAFV